MSIDQHSLETHRLDLNKKLDAIIEYVKLLPEISKKMDATIELMKGYSKQAKT